MSDNPTTKLNEKQRLFCECYAIYLNATKSALEAGYSEKTAYSHGARLLKDVEIRAYIDQLLEERTIRKAEVLARLADQATFDIGEIADSDGNIDFAKAKANGLTHLIKSIDRIPDKNGRIRIKYELYDAQSALIHLGRAYGAFTDKQDITSGGQPIQQPTIYLPAVRNEDDSAS